MENNIEKTAEAVNGFVSEKVPEKNSVVVVDNLREDIPSNNVAEAGKYSFSVPKVVG